MSPTPPIDFVSDLKVREPAGLLGESPQTLRNWDRTGNRVSTLPPINGYRWYRREDLRALLERAASRQAIGPAAKRGTDG